MHSDLRTAVDIATKPESLRLELQRCQRESGPQRSRLRLMESVFASAEESIIAVELDGTIVDANPAASGLPGAEEIQLDLILDYRSNPAMYPAFQKFFRERQLPTLAVWGKNDPHFLPAGAEAYRRDNPNAKVVLCDTGHFALETHAAEIADEIKTFVASHFTK